MNGRCVLMLAVVVFAGCGGSGAKSTADGGSGGISGDDAALGLSGEGGPTQPITISQLPPGVTTMLPPLPAMTNVVATERDDSVGIDFDPVNGAVDYRVYPLPSDQDITMNSDGSVTVKNAIYRCAGMRQTFDAPNNLNMNDAGLVTAGKYTFDTSLTTSPTLGYVYVTQAPGSIPVYAVAGDARDAEVGWRETRLKIYTTDAKARQTLLNQNWRDDGIVFYVPATASASTQTVYSSQTAMTVAGQGWVKTSQYYYLSAGMSAHAHDTTPPAPAFQVLTASAQGTQPLMAVGYQPSNPHTELAVGPERYSRAANQGPGPLWHLEWSGLTQPTTLVVEALASGCPFQGMLSAQHLAAPPHQTLYTLGDLQTASATGEVFINGQYDVTTFPKAVARSFLAATPQPHVAADWDWYQGFAVGSDFGTATPVPGCTDFNCLRFQSSLFDFSAYRLDEPNNIPLFTYGQFQGQLWTIFDDSGMDLTGKIRFTALQKTAVSASAYLHVTMSVDIVATDRRYPQILISDQSAPVQEGLGNPNNNTILVQPIMGPSMRYETQVIHGLVNGKAWDVNNQAPHHAFIDVDSAPLTAVGPADSPFEHAGMDRLTTFDVYVSSQKMYAYLDGKPAGCTQYPSGFNLNGPVTVTFGDVLYHEGAPDELVCAQSTPYAFMHEHQCKETKRHFDDLAFKAGVPQPLWNEAAFPCGAY